MGACRLSSDKLLPDPLDVLSAGHPGPNNFDSIPNISNARNAFENVVCKLPDIFRGLDVLRKKRTNNDSAAQSVLMCS